MKYCIALIALSAVFAAVAAVPAAVRNQQMMYFQQHRPSYRHGAGQQAMLVHRFNAPKYASRRSSQQESGAFASGDSIEGATFIQDEPLQDGDAFSVAEAYPSEADDTSALLTADDEAAAAENDVYQPEQNDEYQPQSDAAAAPAPVAPVAHDAPVAAPKKQQKKKVSVAKPAAAAAESSDEADDEFLPASVTKAGHPSAGGSGAETQFPHTFFPMNFGRTSGGAIAVANSFSTGKGGAASHAVAYGSAAGPSKKRRNN